MDVTFTNVLEGARQYFQGLPAATSSTSAGPAYSNNPSEGGLHREPEHQPELPPSSGAYWPPQEASRPPTREQTPIQRPPSLQSDTSRPPSHSQLANHYQYQEQGQFQFPRPHSREAPSNQYQQQYQQRVTPPTSQYHQLQNVGYYQQQQKSYYQMQGKVANTGYKAPASQAQENPYYKHLYTSHAQTGGQVQVQYAAQKVEGKQEGVNQMQGTSQGGYRATHNLPPIASLAHISYHSNRGGRDLVRTAVPKTKTAPTNSTSQAAPKPVSASTTQQYHQYQQYAANQRLPMSQNYQYGTTTTQNYTQVIMTTSNSTSYAAPVQSSSQYYQKAPTQNSQNSHNSQNQNSQSSQSSQNVNGRIAPVVKQKRESPLDLSVKTVRTPADSTLDDEDRKFYTNRTAVNYPTYDVYANSFQRTAANRQQVPTATAPKMDFHPNFNVTSLNQTMNYNRRPVSVAEKQTANTQRVNYGSTNRYPTVSVPTAAHVNSYIQGSPQKRENLPRVDFSPQKSLNMYQMPEQKKRPADTAPSIIPNKMTKVDVWKQRMDQQIEQRINSYQQQQAKKALVNGNYSTPQPVAQERPKEVYNAYQNRQYQQYPQYHNQTYVPSASVHQYPGYQYPSQQQQQQQQQQNYNLPRTNSNSSIAAPRNNIGGADKRVLSLLRNSLEIKGAKEAQKKLEQEQMNRSYEKHPSTDVTAPLQPKPGFINRHNVSPFTPTNLPDNNNMYKLHIPKAIDSVNFESESGKLTEKLEDSQAMISNHVNPNGDLDGLAALVAARIRTKAELKQVSDKIEGNPPKLCKEKQAFPPRRRLFSRNEEDGGSNVPLRDKTGLRSSSETSVFDFPDSDSEGEMPVLERQTLEDMRRDRRSSTKPTEVKMESPRSSSPDDAFTQACDSFVEQLKNGSGKKRGRRKKLEPDVLAKLESVTKERPIDVTIKTEAPAKSEVEDEDSDVPLSTCMKVESPVMVTKQLSVSLTDISQLKVKEERGSLKEVSLTVPRPARKPAFGDGSHFYPGWEEEVYKYKKSLRMPAPLIHVTRPPQYHRLSTSLPDLDPCPNSPVADDHPKNKTKIKSENIDSDNESNHSFNIFSKHNYDSEGSSSIKSLPNTTKESNSILDRLLERYGARKKRKHKRKEDSPKVTPKNDKVELLPTPGFEREDTAKSNPEFRKKTIESFKEVFLKKSRKLVKQKVSIKEVFGEERPASAPPVTCVNNIKIKEEPGDEITLSTLIKKEDDNSDFDTRQMLKNKLLSRGRKENLLKTLVDKKIKSELRDDDDDDDPEQDSKSETPSIDGDEGSLSGKKRSKFRNIRRKFSSGFDYIRKKKKQKKDQDDPSKPKKGGKFTSKSNPGSVQDIQKEIKGWVLNKGIGETILHRAARLGYTDITAYCLEKMECSPSPKDNAGYTPLHEASTKGNLAIAKMLLMYGANVSESARGGIRPLHEAVENGYVEIVRLLLSYGADPMLATYSGNTPLSLCADDTTTKLLQNHINDVEGQPGSPWQFAGPASCFDLQETGFDVLEDDPTADPLSEEEDLEFEVSESVLPNLYTLRGEAQSDRWILLQDLSSMLKIKSRDALLRQICPTTSSSSVSHKSVLRELKMSDFLEQAHCCQFLNIGEKINTRASKIALVKYTDKVRELLNVEKVTISVR
ncbi:uncharacterized protein LOC135125337 [Zophobas morio]|uniref:uncharacterized protein LOC135125337 n=1 Tax=Zophobas morio TaxID=2755281 RepID=UPI003082CE55